MIVNQEANDDAAQHLVVVVATVQLMRYIVIQLLVGVSTQTLIRMRKKAINMIAPGIKVNVYTCTTADMDCNQIIAIAS